MTCIHGGLLLFLWTLSCGTKPGTRFGLLEVLEGRSVLLQLDVQYSLFAMRNTCFVESPIYTSAMFPLYAASSVNAYMQQSYFGVRLANLAGRELGVGTSLDTTLCLLTFCALDR
jgi:hypothetical protein